MTYQDEEFSNCCGAARWGETDICSDCQEHADFEDGELCRNGKPIAECNCC